MNFLKTKNEQQFKPIDKVLEDFASTADSVSTNKNLNVKNTVTVDATEVFQKRGQRVNRTSIANINYTLSTFDYLLAVTDLTLLAPSIGLPDPRLVRVGKVFVVKDEVGGAATTTITVRSEGEKNIDGSTSTTLTTNYQAKSFYSDGSNWYTY